MIPLHLLQIGEPAVVEDLDGPDASVHRLREMGVEPGAEIEIVQDGCPCIVRIGGQRLCLRLDDSITIFVSPAPLPRPTA
jgi:Fe2+ transport system protein FeoA